MERKITGNLFFIGILSALLATLLTAGAFHTSFDRQIRADLQSSAELAAEAYSLSDDPDRLEQLDSKNLRITLIADNGEVLFESDADKNEMNNHADRPEVADARLFGTGSSVRRSQTRMTDEYYYAIRLSDGNILRASVESEGNFAPYFATLPALIGVLLLLLVLSIFLAVALTKNLLRPIRRLSENIDEVEIDGAAGNKIYEEFVPFVEKIRAQRDENRRQLKKLTEEEERLSVIIASMAEGLIVLDREKRVLMINESAKRYLGCEIDPIRQNIVRVTRNRRIIECIERGSAESSYLDTISLEDRKLQIMSGPVISSGKSIGILCFILDVTEKVQAEKMRQEFTANVSHELKTPLTSISGYAEMIEAGMATGADSVKFAAKIRKEAGRMLTLIRDIIRLSELDEGNTDELNNPVELLSLAQECAASLALAAEKHSVTVTVTGVQSVVAGSREMLSELIYNLIDNGIRYNKPGGKVEVAIAERMLRVSDNGIGIPAKNQPRIFERFYRVDKSRSKESGGTGLGLAIVKHIAGLHHAKLELTSEEDVGTCITVRF